MTFSDKRVIDLVKQNFVAVWESVAPVRTVTFDLGDGKTITGTTGGETAIFFCTPEGGVFDILPALHSPKVVYDVAAEAAAFYGRIRTFKDPLASIRWRHKTGLAAAPAIEESAKRQTLRERWRSPGDPASADLTRMYASKSGFHTPTESIVVVEPGGLPYYRRQVHELLSVGPLRLPRELRQEVFENILNEPLDARGQVVYPWDSPQPFSIHESPGDFDVEEP